jgi:hypothetical protein
VRSFVKGLSTCTLYFLTPSDHSRPLHLCRFLEMIHLLGPLSDHLTPVQRHFVHLSSASTLIPMNIPHRPVLRKNGQGSLLEESSQPWAG